MRKVNQKWKLITYLCPHHFTCFCFQFVHYNINDALKTILSIVARITKANKAWQLSRPGGTYGDSGDYGNTGCQVFKRGVPNWKDFCLKVNMLKGNY